MALSLAACAGEIEDEQGVEDAEANASFLPSLEELASSNEAADAFGISERSYAGQGVIRLMNEASLGTLRNSVGLSQNLSNALVAARTRLGRFSTLTEIDSVPNTGAVFFGRVRSYAEQNNFIGRCGDARIERVIESCDDSNVQNGDGCSSICQLETACIPDCSGRTCGADARCGQSCGNCEGICSTAGICLNGSGDAPRFLSLSTNRLRIAPNQSVEVMAIITDAQGFSDIAGGDLYDEASGRSYAAFAPRVDRGAYQLSISYQTLTTLRAATSAEGLSFESRTLRARFFDQAGHLTSSDFVVELAPCADAQAVLCAGQCVAAENATYYQDADFDGVGGVVSRKSCGQPFGYVKPVFNWLGQRTNVDCNDGDATIAYPINYYRDADLDGYGSTPVAVCSATEPSGYSTNNSDCDDNDNTVAVRVWVLDRDGDGFGGLDSDGLFQGIASCIAPNDGQRWVTAWQRDCNDGDPSTSPSSTEICNGRDDNCNDQIDEDCTPPTLPNYRSSALPDEGLAGHFAGSVALSDDGNVVVVGDHYRTGTVSVLRRQAGSNPTVWERAVLLERPRGTEYALDVAISSDGSTIAVGDGVPAGIYPTGVALYHFAANRWSLVRRFDLGGDFAFAGLEIALSGNGRTLAVGQSSANANQGRVRIFETDTSWIGSTSSYEVPRPPASRWFGESIALSHDGAVLVTGGAPGAPRIYERRTNYQEGFQLSVDPSIGLQRKVTMSADGSTVAMGAYRWRTGGPRGPVVFQRRTAGWDAGVVVPSTLPSFVMSRVVLSADGNTLAFGGVAYGSPTQTGVSVARRANGTWLSERSLTPPEGSVTFGDFFAVNGNGSMILVGDLNSRGRVTVFEEL